MDPLTGGLLSGGMSLLGNIFGQRQNNEFQQQMLQQQENYQTQMSNTAYQRASSDMKAAGLNPMMMFGSGSAASTPSVQPAQKTSALTSIGPAVDKMISSALSMKTFDKLTEEIANLRAEQEKTKAQTVTEWHKPPVQIAEARNIRAGAKLREEELPVILNEAQKAKAETDVHKGAVGAVLQKGGIYGHDVSKTISPISNIVSSAGGVMNMYRGRRSPTVNNFWPSRQSED